MTENRVTKAWLDGNEYEFLVAAEQFATGDTRIIREVERCFLADPALDSCPTDELFDIGAPIVQLVNAVCRMADAGFKSVALSGTFDHSDGGVTIAAPTAEIRTRASAGAVVTTRGGATQPPSPTRAEKLAEASAVDPDIASIVVVMGSGDDQLGWVELWKVYEFLRKYAEQSAPSGDGKAVVRMGWARRQEIENFEASANHPSLSGQDARHAIRPKPPSGTKIEISQGRSLINHLVDKMLDDVL